MKLLLAVFLLTFGITSFANDARELTAEEKVVINKLACKAFSDVFGPYVKFNKEVCRKKSSFKIRENDPQHGTYIFGTLQYSSTESRNCNMSLENNKITGIDCADE